MSPVFYSASSVILSWLLTVPIEVVLLSRPCSSLIEVDQGLMQSPNLRLLANPGNKRLDLGPRVRAMGADDPVRIPRLRRLREGSNQGPGPERIGNQRAASHGNPKALNCGLRH